MHQAVSRSLLKIASYLLKRGVDVTKCLPAEEGQERRSSSLLLLIEAAQVPS